MIIIYTATISDEFNKFIVNLQFNSDGSKNVVSMPSGWQKLSRCQAIGKSKNRGKRSGITVIDIDIKKTKNGVDSLLDVDIDLDDYQTYLAGVDVKNDNGVVNVMKL